MTGLTSLGVLAVLALAAGDDERGFKRLDPPAKSTDDEARLALVIGNSAYAAAPLSNPVHDAKRVAASLRSVGFAVTELHDVNRDGMLRAIRDFGARLQGGGVGVFYFAGHGIQVQGRSYLVPVDAQIRIASDVTLEAVDAGHVLARMEEAKNRLNLVVLDACRNNPIARSWRAAEGGLAFLQAPTGTLIAYATAPGQTAADGQGDNSAYSLAFAEELRAPGLKVEDVFKRVRTRTREATGGVQVPWESSSLEGDFFFVPEGGSAKALDLSVSPAAISGVALGGLGTGSPSGQGDSRRFRQLEEDLQSQNFWAATAATLWFTGALSGGTFALLGGIFLAVVAAGTLNSPMLDPSRSDLGLDPATQSFGAIALMLFVPGVVVTALSFALCPWWYFENEAALETFEELKKIDPYYGTSRQGEAPTAQAY